jgi:hypothetical protein
MTMIVMKPFNTRQRRFKTGDTVRPADDLRPMGFAALKAGGFIGEPAKDPRATSPAKASRRR